MMCWLSREALNAMVGEGERTFPMETGGLLMGYWGEGSPVVTHVIGPGPNANHFRCNFEPDYQWQTDAVEKFYKANDGRITYLGDWHTHPCGPTDMSGTDKRAIQNIKDHKEAYAPTPLMIILGNHLDTISIYCLASEGIDTLDIKTFTPKGSE
jgi:integrative and conjugative element protein (TIGR02256 family)